MTVLTLEGYIRGDFNQAQEEASAAFTEALDDLAESLGLGDDNWFVDRVRAEADAAARDALPTEHVAE